MAIRTRKAWFAAATHPDRVEHLFAVDEDDHETIAAVAQFPHAVVTETGGGCVAAWNLAARRSKGEVLVQLSDNLEPVEGWDDQFARRLRAVDQPGVLKISDGHRTDDLLCMAIFTRPWLEQLGTFLHPGYFSMFSDDEFSFRAYEAGVVIDARDLVFLAKSPGNDSKVTKDATYKQQMAPEHYFKGEVLFLKRNPEALGRWIHQGTGGRHFLAKNYQRTNQKTFGILQDVNSSARLAEDDANWRNFGRSLDAMLVKKVCHFNIFARWTMLLLFFAQRSTKGIFGHLAWGIEHRKRLSDLSNAAQHLLEETSSKKENNSIEAYLETSCSLTDLLEVISLSKVGAKVVNKTVLKALKAEQNALQKWWVEVKRHSQTRPDLMGSYPWTKPNQDNIPIYITSFNQHTYLRNMIRQLRLLGVLSSDIHIVDNASTSIPVIDYLTELKCQGVIVHHLDRNYGPRAIFDPESGIVLPPVFALTDPDLQFHEAMPSTFRQDLLQIALWCRVWKAGSALNIKESDMFRQGEYHHGMTIREWEDGFWRQPISNWTDAVGQRLGDLRTQIFSAAIDTTFAVYLRDKKELDFGEAVRVAGPFEVRHLPWYKASEQQFIANKDDHLVGAQCRLADGRIMVRPGLLEIEEYVSQGFGSTISSMNPTQSSSYISITHPVGPYSFAVDAHTAHLDWWNSKFESDDINGELQLLRQLSQSTRGASRLIDIGASFGPISLWSALRFEHVYAIESNSDAVAELHKNISINRFEHCVTVVEGDFSTNSAFQHLSEPLRRNTFDIHSLVHAFQIPLNKDNLIVCCHLEGDMEALWNDLLRFALEKSDVVGAVLLKIGAKCANHDQVLKNLVVSTIGPEGYLKGWSLHSGTSGHLSYEHTFKNSSKGTSDTILAWVNPYSIQVPTSR